MYLYRPSTFKYKGRATARLCRTLQKLKLNDMAVEFLCVSYFSSSSEILLLPPSIIPTKHRKWFEGRDASLLSDE